MMMVSVSWPACRFLADPADIQFYGKAAWD